MSDALRLAGYREPLGLWAHDGARLAEHPDLRSEDLEFSSRGDRVTARVLLPGGGGPHPLALLQSGGDAPRGDAFEAPAVVWAERGLAVAAIDLPHQGARGDAKRTGRASAALAHEIAQQGVIDLERALDALTTREWIDEERIAFVGLGSAAGVGSAFCALDPRVRAAAIDVAGARGAAGVDADAQLERLASRPLLRIEQADGLSEPALQPVWDFLARAFAL